MKRYHSPVVYLLAALLIALVVVLKKSKKPSEVWPRIEERLDEGRNPRLLDDIRYGSFWAGVANAVLLGGLILTFPWWGGKRSKPVGSGATENDGGNDAENGSGPGETLPPSAPRPPPACGHRVFWPLLLTAVVIAGALRWELAHRSLWVDELLASKQAIVGYFPDKGDEQDTFKPATWEKTFFYYSKPRNHVVFSALSRASHLTWLSLTGRAQHEFNEFVFRLPSFLAGLFSVALVGLLLKRWGLAWAGILAALLLAVHPWHIRYGIDGRSYGLTIVFILGAMHFLTGALRSGRWRSWIGFGACQFLMLWGSMTTLWICVLFFGAAFVLVWRQSAAGDRGLALGRLLVVNVFAGMLFLQLMAPNLLQISRWDFMEGGTNYPALTLNKVFTTIGYLAWGDVELDKTMRELRPRNTVLLAFIPFFVWGGLALFRNSRLAFTLTMGILAAAVLFLAFTAFNNYFYYPRFLSFLVIPMVILCACGAMDIAGLLFGKHAFGPPLTVFLATSLFVFMNMPRIDILTTRPIEPIRDVVEFVSSHPASNSWQPIAFGHGADLARQYDSRIQVAKDREQLISLLKSCVTEGKEPVIFYGHPELDPAEHMHLRVTSQVSPSSPPSEVNLTRAFKRFEGHTFSQTYTVLRCAPMSPALIEALRSEKLTDR